MGKLALPPIDLDSAAVVCVEQADPLPHPLPKSLLGEDLHHVRVQSPVNGLLLDHADQASVHPHPTHGRQYP